MRYTITLLAALLAGAATAQEAWSLRQCIDYAIEHNLTVRQREITHENSKITLNTAKMSRLPAVSASVGESFGFGRSQGRDGTTEDYTSSQTYFSINGSMPIFTGFRIPNQVKAYEFDVKSSLAELDQAKDDLALSITGYYLQALFCKELEAIASEQVALTSRQLEQTRALVDAGRSAVSELYDSEAQLASNELALTQAHNNTVLALLDLSQALNLDDNRSFDIAAPVAADSVAADAVLTNPVDIYAYSVENRPAIRASQFSLESSKKQLLVAKSAYYPTLNLSGGYGNNYYYSYNLPAGYTNSSFRDQLKINGSESVSLSLSIPLFNRFATRNAVRQSRLAIESKQIALAQAKQSLFKEIQQAYTNAVASQDKYRSAAKASQSAQVAFDFEQTKYDNGRSTALELSNARTRLEKALSEEAQAKYDLLFRTKILEFYQGIPL
jgi:outer membrane protein